MTVVTPIEPHIRRRDARLTPAVERGADRRPERDARIPVFREPAPTAARSTQAVVEAERLLARGAATHRTTRDESSLSEGALAARFFPLAALVVAVDLATKAWAASALSAASVPLSRVLSLSLAYNSASAGGVSLGEHTRALNFAGTGVVVGLLVMIAPSLTRFDRRAWVALALIAGAGFGNLVGLLSGDRGVVDFLAFRRPGGGAWVLNVADVALGVGLVLLARTALRLVRAARSGATA